jgi:hypothetical protein
VCQLQKAPNLMAPVSLLLPSGPDTTDPSLASGLHDGPFARLKTALSKTMDYLPDRKSLGFSIAMASMALPTSVMACDLTEYIAANPSRDFSLTDSDVICVWFDSPVLANTMPINQNTVTRICAKDGVDRLARGVADLGAGPPSDVPGAPVREYLADVSVSLVDLGGRLTDLAQTVDSDYRRPEGTFWSKPLDEQDTRVLFPSGRADALAREVDAVRDLTDLDGAFCRDLQAGMEMAVNADRIAWRRDSVLAYDADYARTANEAYTSWLREDQARRERAAPAPLP